MLTKVAGGQESCVSPTGGVIVTSRDPSQVLALGEDDCVLLRKSVGDPGDVARSLAIDGLRAPDAPIGGNLWIGMQTSQRVLELDGQNANVLMEIPTPGLTPFDAAFDPWGALWVVDRGGRLARIDPVVDPPTVEIHEAPLACYELDSLASDTRGTLTLTGSSCEDVLVYEPASNHFLQVKTPALLDARGVAVLGQDSWVTHTAGRVSRVGRDPLAIEDTFELAADGFAPLESIAIGADSFGQLWIVSSMGAPSGYGVLTRFDPMQQRVSAEVPLGRLPRGKGDITGDRRLGVVAPEATAQHVFDGCGGPQVDPSMPRPPQQTDWLRVHVAWNPGVGSSVVVEGRRAKDRDTLADAPFTVLGTLPRDQSPFDVPFETGGVVELRLTLRAAGRIGAPRIARVGLEWRCPGPS
jgi:streptogramin lyase